MPAYIGEIYQNIISGDQFRVISWNNIALGDRIIELPGYSGITKDQARLGISCWRAGGENVVYVYTNSNALIATLSQKEIVLIYQPPKCILCEDHIPDLHYLCEKCRL